MSNFHHSQLKTDEHVLQNLYIMGLHSQQQSYLNILEILLAVVKAKFTKYCIDYVSLIGTNHYKQLPVTHSITKCDTHMHTLNILDRFLTGKYNVSIFKNAAHMLNIHNENFTHQHWWVLKKHVTFLVFI